MHCTESLAFLCHKVPPALGNKVIHPYSDLLLHDIVTGYGIVQIGDAVFPSQAAKNLRKATLRGDISMRGKEIGSVLLPQPH